MSYFNQRFARPEPEPWKSDWRKSVEARFGEPVTRLAPEKPVVKVKRERINVVRVHIGHCASCPTELTRGNTSGFCKPCYQANRNKTVRTPRPTCPNLMTRKNKLGLCHICAAKTRRERDRPKCSDCGKGIRRSNKYGKCEYHAASLRAKVSLQKKRAELAVAA